MIPGYRKQIAYWKKFYLNPRQEVDVANFSKKLDRWELVIDQILRMIPQLKNETIDLILEKDDMELGLEVLSRNTLFEEEDFGVPLFFGTEESCSLLMEIHRTSFVIDSIAQAVNLTEKEVIECMYNQSFGVRFPGLYKLGYLTAFTEEQYELMNADPYLVYLPSDLMKDILSRPIYRQVGQTLEPMQDEVSLDYVVEMSQRLMDVMNVPDLY